MPDPKPFVITRATRANIPASGALRAGAALADLTPDLGTPRAGWATHNRMKALHGRLRAAVLVLDDGQGERVALVSCDLHAGARLLTELTASSTASVGLDTPRVLLMGTHTHSGPARLYGNPHFDQRAGDALSIDPGFDLDLATDLAGRLAAAIQEAVTNLRPARVGIGSALCIGLANNRSLPAAGRNGLAWTGPATRAAEALANDESVDHTRPTSPEATRRAAMVVSAWTGAPDDDPYHAIVDRRIRVVWAEDLAGAPIGAIAVASVHNALIPTAAGVCSGDLFGATAWTLRRELGGAPLGFAAGALGDVDPVFFLPASAPWRELLADRAGWTAPHVDEGVIVLRRLRAKVATLAAATRAAILDARSQLRDALPLRVRWSEATRDDAPPSADLFPDRAPAPLAPPIAGWVTANGSELGRGAGAAEGSAWPSRRPADPHWPKLNFLEAPLAEHTPIHLVRLGDTWILGLPVEPTTFAARCLAEAADPDARAPIVVGVCGDYRGYLTTPHEYVAQHYEGSSTLEGRHAARWYFGWIQRAVAGPSPTPPAIVRLPGPAQRYPQAFPARRGEPPAAPVSVTVDAADGVLDVRWPGRLPRDGAAVSRGPIAELTLFDASGAELGRYTDEDPIGLLGFTEPIDAAATRWVWRVLLPEPGEVRSAEIRVASHFGGPWTGETTWTP